MPWVALGGHPLGERDRDGKRQMRGQSRQPLMLLVDLSGGPFDARQSDAHVVAEAIDCVVGPAGADALDGKVGPFGKLRSEQTSDEGGVDVDLGGMHFSGAHEDLLGEFQERSLVETMSNCDQSNREKAAICTTCCGLVMRVPPRVVSFRQIWCLRNDRCPRRRV